MAEDKKTVAQTIGNIVDTVKDYIPTQEEAKQAARNFVSYISAVPEKTKDAIEPVLQAFRPAAESLSKGVSDVMTPYQEYMEKSNQGAGAKFFGKVYAQGLQGLSDTPLNIINSIDAIVTEGKPVGPELIKTASDYLNAQAAFSPVSFVGKPGSFEKLATKIDTVFGPKGVDEIAPVVSAISNRPSFFQPVRDYLIDPATSVIKKVADNPVSRFVGNVIEGVGNAASLIQHTPIGRSLLIQTMPFTAGWIPEALDQIGVPALVDNIQADVGGREKLQELGLSNPERPGDILKYAQSIDKVTPNNEADIERYLAENGRAIPEGVDKTKSLQDKVDQIKDISNQFGQSRGSKTRDYFTSFFGKVGALQPPQKGSQETVVTPTEQPDYVPPVVGSKYIPAKATMDTKALEELYWSIVPDKSAYSQDKRNNLFEQEQLLKEQRNNVQQTYFNTIADRINTDKSFADEHSLEYQSLLSKADQRFATLQKYAVYRSALDQGGISKNDADIRALLALYNTSDEAKARKQFLEDTTVNGTDISIALGQLKTKADLKNPVYRGIALGFAKGGDILENIFDTMQQNSGLRGELAKAGAAYIINDIDDSAFAKFAQQAVEKLPETVTVFSAQISGRFMQGISKVFGTKSALGLVFKNPAIQGGSEEVIESLAMSYMGGEKYSGEENFLDFFLGMVMGHAGSSRIEKHINPTGLPNNPEGLERAIFDGNTLIETIQNQAMDIATQRKSTLQAKADRSPEESQELSELQKRTTPAQVTEYYADDIRATYFFLKDVVKKVSDYVNDPSITPQDEKKAIVGDYQATIAKISILDRIINGSQNSDYVAAATQAKAQVQALAEKQAAYIADPKFQSANADVTSYDNYLKTIYGVKVQKPPMTNWGKALLSTFTKTQTISQSVSSLQQDMTVDYDKVTAGVYKAEKSTDIIAPIQFYDRPVQLSIDEYGYTLTDTAPRIVQLNGKDYTLQIYAFGEQRIPVFVDTNTGAHAILYWLDTEEQNIFNQNIKSKTVSEAKSSDLVDDKNLTRYYKEAGGKSTIITVDTPDVQTHHVDTENGTIYINDSLTPEQKTIETKKGMVAQIILAMIKDPSLSAKSKKVYETMLTVYNLAKAKISKASTVVAQMLITFNHFVQHLRHTGMIKYLKSIKNGAQNLRSMVLGAVGNYLSKDDINVIIENAPAIMDDESYQIAREVDHYIQHTINNINAFLAQKRAAFSTGLSDLQKKYTYSHVAAVAEMIPRITSELYGYMQNTIQRTKGNVQDVMLSLYSISNYLLSKSIDTRAGFKHTETILNKFTDIANGVGIQLLAIALSDRPFLSNTTIDTQQLAGISQGELVALLEETDTEQLFDEYATYISYVLNLDPKYLDVIDRKKIQEILLMNRLNQHQKTLLALPYYPLIGENGRLQKSLIKTYIRDFIAHARATVVDAKFTKEEFVARFATIMENLLGENDYIVYNAIKAANKTQDIKAEVEAFYDLLTTTNNYALDETENNIVRSLVIFNNVSRNYLGTISAYPLTVAKFIGSLLARSSAIVYDAEIFRTENQDNIFAYSSYLNFPEKTVEYIKRDLAKFGNTKERRQQWRNHLTQEYVISRGFQGRNLTVSFFQIMQTMDFLEVAPMLDGTSVEKVVSYNLALAFQQYWNTKSLGLKVSRESQKNTIGVKPGSIVITVGKTGSGKSFRARQFAGKEGYQIFSIHDYIQKDTNQMTTNDWTNAFAEMTNDLRTAIQKSKNQIFIIDTSNLQKSRRNEFATVAKLNGLAAYAVPFYIDDEVRVSRAIAAGIDEAYARRQGSDKFSQQDLEKEGFTVLDETLGLSDAGYIRDFITAMNSTIGEFITESNKITKPYTISKTKISINPKIFPIQDALVNHPELLFDIVKRLDPTTYIEVVGGFYRDNSKEGIAAQLVYNADAQTFPVDVLIEDYRRTQMGSKEGAVISKAKQAQILQLLSQVSSFLDAEKLPEVKTQLAYAIIDSLRAKGIIPHNASSRGDLMNTYSVDRLYAVSAYNQNYQVYLQHYIVKDLVNRYGLYSYDGDYYNYAQGLIDDYINYPDINKTPKSLVYRLAHLFGRTNDLRSVLPEVYTQELVNDFSVDALNAVITTAQPIDQDTIIFLPNFKFSDPSKANINFTIPYREGKIYVYDTTGRDVVFTDLQGKSVQKMVLPLIVLEGNNIVIVAGNDANADKAFKKIALDNTRPEVKAVGTTQVGDTINDMVQDIARNKQNKKAPLAYSKGDLPYGINLVKGENGEITLAAEFPKAGTDIANRLNAGYAPTIVRNLSDSVNYLQNKSTALSKEAVKATSRILGSINETKNTVLSNIGADHPTVQLIKKIYADPTGYVDVFTNLATAIPYYVNNFFPQEQLVTLDPQNLMDVVLGKAITEEQFIGLFFQKNIIDQVDTLLHLANEAGATLFDWEFYAKGVNKTATLQNMVGFFSEKNAAISGKYGAYIHLLYNLVTDPDYTSQWQPLVSYMDPSGRSESVLDEFLARQINFNGELDANGQLKTYRIDVILNSLINAAGLKQELFIEDFALASQDTEGELEASVSDEGDTKGGLRFINKTKNANIQFLVYMSDFIAHLNRPEIGLPFREGGNFVALPLVRALITPDIGSAIGTAQDATDFVVKFYTRELDYIKQLEKDSGLSLKLEKKKLVDYINRSIGKIINKPGQKTISGYRLNTDVAAIKTALAGITDTVKAGKTITFASLINGLNIYTAYYADVSSLTFVAGINDNQKTLLKKIGVDIDAAQSMSLAQDGFSLYEEKVYKYISLLGQIHDRAFAMYLPDAGANRKMIAEKLVTDMAYASVAGPNSVVNKNFSNISIRETVNKLLANRLPAGQYQKVLAEFQSLLPGIDLAVDVLNNNQKNFADLMLAMKEVSTQVIKSLLTERRLLKNKGDQLSLELVDAINSVISSSTDLVQQVQATVLAGDAEQNNPNPLYAKGIDEENLKDLSTIAIGESIDEAGQTWLSDSYIDYLTDQDVQQQVQKVPTQSFVVLLSKFIVTAYTNPRIRSLDSLRRVMEKYKEQVPGIWKVMENNKIFDSREQFEKFYETVFNGNPQAGINVTLEDVVKIKSYQLPVLDFDLMKKYFKGKEEYRAINQTVGDVLWQKQIYDYAVDFKNNAATLTAERMNSVHTFITQFDQNKILDPQFKDILLELDQVWREYDLLVQKPAVDINDVVLEGFGLDKQTVADRYFDAVQRLVGLVQDKQISELNSTEKKLQKEIQTLQPLLNLHYPQDPGASTLYVENRMKKYFTNVVRSSGQSNTRVVAQKKKEYEDRIQNESNHVSDVLTNCM